MFAVEDLLQRNAEMWRDAPCGSLRLRGWGVSETVGKREKGMGPKFDGLGASRGS